MSLSGVLLVLLIAQCLGTCFFTAFDVETAIWRRLLKCTIFHGGTIALYFAVGTWCLLLPFIGLLAGSIVHYTVCRRHGFHLVYATPRRSYYAYRGWAWPD